MTVDPTDPDTTENETDIPEPKADDELVDLSVEAPEADAAEQAAGLTPPQEAVPAAGPDGANEADLVEQARVVELDEDDYR